MVFRIGCHYADHFPDNGSRYVGSAQPIPERIAWNRTPEVLAGRLVIVKLTDGTRIAGSWVSVTPSTFTLSVEKTSDKREVRKGLQTLPKSSIAEARARKRRVRGCIIGTLSGFYGIAALGGALSGSREALQGFIGIAAYGGAIAGYFIGRASDRATREIILLPQESAPPQPTPTFGHLPDDGGRKGL